MHCPVTCRRTGIEPQGDQIVKLQIGERQTLFLATDLHIISVDDVPVKPGLQHETIRAYFALSVVSFLIRISRNGQNTGTDARKNWAAGDKYLLQGRLFFQGFKRRFLLALDYPFIEDRQQKERQHG
jgi:hypothetical protein